MRLMWSAREIIDLEKFISGGLSAKEIAKRTGRTVSAVEGKIAKMRRQDEVSHPPQRIPESVMPIYNEPLKSEGDAVIISDIEAPYQHSDFVNRVLDLAYSWKVKTLHLNGDLLHMHNLSAWGAEWLPESDTSKLDAILEFIQSLPAKKKEEGLAAFEKSGLIGGVGGGLSDEMAESRRVFRGFDLFDSVLVGLGNHDDRYLRALDCALKPKELLRQLDRHDDKRWQIAPYYYTMLETEAGLFRNEHPRMAGRTAAIDLCVQYHCHITMGHSHRWAVNRDPSGKFWAIQAGHCVDESRLAYVMQRSAKRDAHCLGAVIVRGGVPYVLGEWTQWELMKRM